MITRFMDMHTGGDIKITPYQYIYIEANNEEGAITLFNRDPDNVTCDCCGFDYSITSSDTLEEETEYDRKGISLEAYINKQDVLVILRH